MFANRELIIKKCYKKNIITLNEDIYIFTHIYINRTDNNLFIFLFQVSNIGYFMGDNLRQRSAS